MRPPNHQLIRARLSPAAWLSILMGATLAARADLTQSEQEAFDHYFRLPTASQLSDWKAHLNVGAAVGFNISAKFNENGLFNLPDSSLASGVYDNGYVLPDSSGTQETTDWGYLKTSQYNAAAQTVTLNRTTSFQTADSGSRDQGGPFPGFELDYGGSLHQWQNFRVGWDFGFDLVPMSISDHETLTATVYQTAAVFNTGGIPLPTTVPYQGTANIPGPAFELPLQPAYTTNSTTTGTVSGSRTLDTIFYAFRLGPTLYWDLSRDWTVSLGAGPAFGIVSAEYKYNEVITTATSANSSGSFSGLDFVYGGDVNATLLYHTADSARPVDLYLSAQFMPLSSADFSQGGRDAKLDLSGQVYISAGVNWPF